MYEGSDAKGRERSECLYMTLYSTSHFLPPSLPHPPTHPPSHPPPTHLHGIHHVSDHTEDVKSRQYWLRQVHLWDRHQHTCTVHIHDIHVHVCTCMYMYSDSVHVQLYINLLEATREWHVQEDLVHVQCISPYKPSYSTSHNLGTRRIKIWC